MSLGFLEHSEEPNNPVLTGGGHIYRPKGQCINIPESATFKSASGVWPALRYLT